MGSATEFQARLRHVSNIELESASTGQACADVWKVCHYVLKGVVYLQVGTWTPRILHIVDILKILHRFVFFFDFFFDLFVFHDCGFMTC